MLNLVSSCRKSKSRRCLHVNTSFFTSSLTAKVRLIFLFFTHRDLDLRPQEVQLLSERLGESRDPVLGRRIDIKPRKIGHSMPAQTVYVHDVALDVMLLHAFDGFACGDAQPQHVHVEGGAPRVVIPVHERRVFGHSGVVDQDVDGAEGVLDPGEGFHDLVLLGYVGLVGVELAGLVGEVLGALLDEFDAPSDANHLEKSRRSGEI
jgi:hypothetical protein